VMASAERMGAVLCMPAVLDFAKYISGAWQVNYQDNTTAQTLSARVLVNATGPWVNETLKRIQLPVQPIPISLVQGAHICLPGQIKQGIYYVEALKDGRAVFIMPKQDKILVGTTETKFQGDIADVKPLDSEINYLLATFKHYFPEHRVGLDDVMGAFAGLRVLPTGGSDTAFSRSRETILQTDRDEKPRLLSIYGGKLTAYRHTASCVIDKLRHVLPTDVTSHGDTSEIMLE